MRAFRIAMTASALGAGLAGQPLLQHAAQAQSQPSAAVDGPTALLVNRATHWRAQGSARYALRELDRVLDYAPNNTDVLVMATDIAMELGDGEAAARYRHRLSQVAPSDVRFAALAAEHQRTPAEVEMLSKARRLAQAGQPGDAVLQYKELFGTGAVPRSLAVEFYSTLAATPDGFDQATDGLGTLAEQFPTDARLQLAYARVLVRDEGSRSNGIKRLSELAKDPGIGIDARQAWRETLLWQGASEKARTQLQTYLASNATDAEIEAKRKEYDATLPDEGTKALLRGYNIMATDIEAAKREFNATLTFNPRNPDAMVMLAAIDRMQQQPEAAQELIDRAVAIAPDRRDELIHSAGGEGYPIMPPSDENQNARAFASTQLAGFAVKQSRFDDAEAFYAKAADLYAKTKNRAGVHVVGLGRAALARDRLRQAAAAPPARPDGRQGVAALAAPQPPGPGVATRRFASSTP